MRSHRHKVLPSESIERPWFRCVSPSVWHGDRGHGGVERLDRCRCGASRFSESCGGDTNYGPWQGGRYQEE